MDKIHVIIEELRQRDYKSFDTFYNLTKNQVFYAIVSIVKDHATAEDIMQDVYMKFLEKIDDSKTNSNPYAYLSTIIIILFHNKIIKLSYNKKIQISTDKEFIGSMENNVKDLINKHSINSNNSFDEMDINKFLERKL